MKFSPLFSDLVENLRCLPGVGPKSAQRMAFHLLERNREGGQALSEALKLAMNEITHCRQCRIFTESELCEICSNSNREQHSLCIVESPADALAIEQAGGFRGLYFVLMGHLSPLDGIGPDELGMDLLSQRVNKNSIEEIIIATNSIVEGEATAHYIATMMKQSGVRTTRIAHGVPVGGELEYIDSSTLSQALAARSDFE